MTTTDESQISRRACNVDDLGVARERCRRRSVAFWLFVVVQLFYGLWATGRFHVMDGYASFYMTESLVERGTIALPQERALFGRKALDGSFHTPYGPLRAIVGVPGYVIGRSLGDALDAEPEQREALLWFGTSLVNTTISALAVAVFFLLVTGLGASQRPALFAALTFAVATPHWHYAETYFSEPLTALLLFASAWLLVDAFRRSENHPTLSRLVLASVPLSLLASERLTMAIFFPIFALTVLCLTRGRLDKRVTSTSVYSILPTIVVFAYLAWNWSRFGDPMQMGYPDRFEGSRPPDAFDESPLRGLHGLLLNNGKGLLFFALPAAIGLLVCRDLHRRAGWLGTWLLFVPLVPLTFYCSFSYWEGAYSWGPRYLVPIIGFWIVPLAFWKSRRRVMRFTWAAAAAFSGGLCLLGVSVSFMECQVTRGYYLEGFRYNLAYPMLETTISVNCQYLASIFDGTFLEEPIGLGFDRWFFLLYKSGFSGAALSAIVIAMAVLFAGSIVGLVVSMRDHRQLTTEAPANDENDIERETSDYAMTSS